jgi:hypothetical protein
MIFCKKFYLLLSIATTITACSSGSDAPVTGTPVTGIPVISPPVANSITVSSCSFTAGDNTQNIDGSTIRVKSHEIGSPLYKIITPRKLDNATDVTMDYMVHQPATTPRGIFLLIAGGPLDSKIEGTIDSTPPTRSSGNFVVRSAHRYQAAGYRVITIDRPSDFNPVAMDAYRNSMKHSVDLAVLLKRENPEGYDVIISGTSRGSISAAAQNTLSAGIAMSSSLTSGSGTPVGSAGLPLSRIERDTHILLHTDDTCSLTLPADSRTLFDNLDTMGIAVSGNEVSGGFHDPVSNNFCGGFSFHGYSGIEACAVSKETDWADNLVTGLATNNAPIAANLAVNAGDPITLTANDADGDTLSFAVPFATSSLGGTVATDSAGVVTYTTPVAVSATIDTFAFTVADGKGGVSTAVVSITLP